ncbi:solute carrier family 50 (sugar transporter) [Angomonas deanei]|nr:solute carrier family 50 (sugar transporter) [Angomonas deanei]|eukprot:EPY43391.1 solute carrier family 50 (sugar transporter) [Angomonas deanei]
MLMSPILTMLQLSKNKSVGTVPIVFFCAQLANCSVWSMYGVLKGAFPVMICNFIGNCIATWCVLTYLTIIRVEEKSGHTPVATTYQASLKLSKFAVAFVVCFLVLLLVLVNFVSFTAASLLNGLAGGCCSVLMLSSPLGMAKDIIKNKNAEGLQPVTIALGTGNSIMWTLYGFLVSPIDPFIFVPNGLCTLACLFQFYLLFRYGRRPKEEVVVVDQSLATVPLDV